MKFEHGKAYKTNGGYKTWYIGSCKNHPTVHAFHTDGGMVQQFVVEEIIGPWEDGPDHMAEIQRLGQEIHDEASDTRYKELLAEKVRKEPETIDVANMWVRLDMFDVNKTIDDDTYWPFKPQALTNTIAILRLHEWEAIKRGDRKLVVGEGL